MTTTQDKTHTSGPWHVGAGNGEGSIFSENGRTRLEEGGTTLYPIARIGRGWDEEEDEANARLIAAAPELLEALQLIYSNAAESPEWIRSRIGSVIAKAEGRDA